MQSCELHARFEMAIGSESERVSVPRRGGKPHHD